MSDSRIDDLEKVCNHCGRIGKRQFDVSDSGFWICSNADACRRRAEQRETTVETSETKDETHAEDDPVVDFATLETRLLSDTEVRALEALRSIDPQYIRGSVTGRLYHHHTPLDAPIVEIDRDLPLLCYEEVDERFRRRHGVPFEDALIAFHADLTLFRNTPLLRRGTFVPKVPLKIRAKRTIMNLLPN